MVSPNGLSTKQRLFVVCNVALGAILLSSAVFSSGARQSKEINLPDVEDNSGTFRLINEEKVDRLFITRMQNTSKKTITAYAKAVCGFPESSTDYSIGNQSIEPGATVEIKTPIKAVADNCDPAKAQPTITILAVILDDKTYAGEWQWAKGILDDRRGSKIQLKRINTLLANALKWPDADQPAALERLKSQIASLPVDEGETPAIQGGLSIAKQRTLFMLDELKQWHQKSLATQSRDVDTVPIRGELAGIHNLQEGINKLIILHERWISKY